MKKIISSIALLIAGVVPVFAQGIAKSEFWKDPLASPLLPFYAVIGFIFIVMLLILVTAAYMLKILNMLTRKAAEERAAKLGIPYVPELSWWKRINQKLTGSVPLEKEAAIILDHNYDGIQELDNHLPPWWKWLFYFTIAWAIVYMVVYHVTDTLPLSEEEFKMEMTSAGEKKTTGPTIDETTIELTTDAGIIESGKQIYASNCSACHKPDGGGDIGPNLTDPYWLHGGTIKDVFRVVQNGVPNTNMISWKGSLSPEKIRDVANFVMSLQGTTPAKAKDPQGELHKPELPSAKADSTQASL